MFNHAMFRTRRYLKFLEGSIGNYFYEYLYRSKNSLLNEVCFLAIDLDNLEFDIEVQNGDINEEKQTSSYKNMFYGILYNKEGLKAVQTKDFIVECLKNCLYLQLKQYEDAFRTIINALQDYLYSSQSENKFTQQQIVNLDFECEAIVMNFMMKIDKNVYLSKSVSNKKNIENKWCVKYVGENNYKDIVPEIDLLNESPEYYLIKQEISEKIQDIILSCNLFSTVCLGSDAVQLQKNINKQSSLNQEFFYLKIKQQLCIM